MREYLCECLNCHKQQGFYFDEPFPSIEEVFEQMCQLCKSITPHKRVLTRKAKAEIRRNQDEQALRQSIIDQCEKYGFQCKFLHQSVIVKTPISSWQFFDYHASKKTLRHESTFKISFKTGEYAKTHEQFRNKKMSCLEIIDYIAAHDKWRQERQKMGERNLDNDNAFENDMLLNEEFLWETQRPH